MKLKVKVVKKQVEALDIYRYELAPVDGEMLPGFSAGAHIDVHVKPGLVRQYSLCNHPDEVHRYVICVLRDPNSRGGSIAMQELVKEGDTLTISEPKNHFPLERGARRTLLIAGGIGVTPLLCMAERLSRLNADFAMHYCARSAERMAFRSYIADQEFAERVSFYFSVGAETATFDVASVIAGASPDTHLYVCGPAGFMDWVIQSAREAGWPEERIHREYFGATASGGGENGSFDVKLASSGKVVSVGADESVVQALARHGVEVEMSCEQGVCGTCITRILEGEPDHRDLFLTDAEHALNDQFTPCCSRAKSKVLVLDI
ncbi:PDR/VanB family oxidoreductase [Paraburkholderia elongata]|uniref:PDR/VanB family oxidoreductase n=1 Tax=Paraburkholderia elongata TaxID=2675747 RepID=UPI002E2C7697|nr:PDR/VanB family oxidoreductase [Paraburkholderia elongata]